ncbi:MAG: triose-phosphate isomerase [Oscillospiraceae bacterium]|nr:triose-phosphate isomerase [Oscillospiraceae bacterium]
MSQKILIAGNFKMNSGFNIRYLTEFRSLAGEAGAIAALLPNFLELAAFCATENAAALGAAEMLGAQNASEYENGAYTGDISAEMLAALPGVKYCLAGHSERRALFGETDGTVAKKTARILAAGLTPIICVGETAGQRENGETFDVISRQVQAVLPEIAGKSAWFAYEPVWAIGTGQTASPEQAGEVCAFITEQSGGFPVLYGGSVNRKNAAELFAQPSISGGLVGGACLDPAHFADIVRAAAI